MNRAQLEEYIWITYGIKPDFPWDKSPTSAVYRHSDNKKWFALVMEVPRVKLGLSGADLLDIVNLKCDPLMITSLVAESGIFPAYHMNKEHWITAALDGSDSDDKLKLLLDISYELTR